MGEGRPGDRAHECVGIDRAEDIGADTGFQQGAHCPAGNLEHLTAIEVCDLRKSPGLGKDQARRGADRRVGHACEQHAQEIAQAGFRVPGGAAGDHGLGGFGQMPGGALDQPVQHRFLGRKIEIDRAFRQAGGAGNVFDTGCGEPLF